MGTSREKENPSLPSSKSAKSGGRDETIWSNTLALSLGGGETDCKDRKCREGRYTNHGLRLWPEKRREWLRRYLMKKEEGLGSNNVH